MSIWTLASEGRHGGLSFGMTMAEVERRFGEPSDRGAGEIRILKYDEVELHFPEDSLWLVHSEESR